MLAGRPSQEMPAGKASRQTNGLGSSTAKSSKQRSPRLRAACNECNIAKVRCTGERAGCQRCHATDLTCVYAESRVGKVPGIRAKKSQPDVAANPQRTSGPTTSRRESASRNNSINSNSEAFPVQDFDNALSNEWDRDIPQELVPPTTALIEDLTMDNYRSPLAQRSAATRQLWTFDARMAETDSDVIDSTIDLDFNPMDPGLSTGLASASGRLQNELQPVTPSTSSSSQTQPRLKRKKRPQVPLESRTVQACCQLVVTLESYIGADIQAFDIILQALKNALNTLKRLAPLHGDMLSLRIHGLFGVIMCQVVQLFEICCADFLQSQDEDGDDDVRNDDMRRGSFTDAKSIPFPPISPELPTTADCFSSFNFGIFQVDSQEQQAWRARVILRELQQACEITQRIIAFGRPQHNQQAWSEAEPQGYFQELQHRLQLLCADIRKASRA